jgi:hypothetical protein
MFKFASSKAFKAECKRRDLAVTEAAFPGFDPDVTNDAEGLRAISAGCAALSSAFAANVFALADATFIRREHAAELIQCLLTLDGGLRKALNVGSPDLIAEITRMREEADDEGAPDGVTLQ